MATEMTCPRDPDVMTRLRCSSCETPICPQCWRDAVVGFHCPDCSEQRHRKAAGATPDQPRGAWGLGGPSQRSARVQRGGHGGSGGPTPSRPREEQDRTDGGGKDRERDSGAVGGRRLSANRLPLGIGTRAVVIGLSAAVGGGLLLGPVLAGGAFFLISAGVIGWLVARAVFWAADERSTPFVRAIAMTLAGFMVAVGLTVAGVTAGVGLLAYPAALWGGWIVVRQR